VVGFCLGFRDTGLWVMKADGSQKLSLSKRAKVPSVVTVGSSWSPKGRRIAFVLDVNGDRSIALVNADGSEFQRLHLVEGAKVG
jgi:Tol biopolymer transport system component